ncbi:hypothetical protein [Pedobacter nyackensis]|uniref:hypothetical protein n=1 Tax=Pedobacter nyackensis TaxID=475255 RepID=UPI0029315347|nr:hypothetical protein [Pedobacter nyackensis]
METFKLNTIEKYLLTTMHISPERTEVILPYLVEFARLQKVLKNQLIEVPGPAAEGRIWLSLNAMTHSYSICQNNHNLCGCMIWKKLELMVFSGSLINHVDRINYIQILEPGYVLSISYPDALILKREFDEINKHLEHIAAKNELAYLHRNVLLHELPQQRVQQFEAENPLFIKVASGDIKAMHVGLSRQGYADQKKKISTEQ